MKAVVRVTLKDGVLDPQGKAITNALHGLGYREVDSVRQGKLLEVDLTAETAEAAAARLDAMCRDLLANLVIEDYAIDIVA